MNLDRCIALKPAKPTRANPGTTKIILSPISPNAALMFSSNRVMKKARPAQTKNGDAATTITNTAAELSLSEGRLSPVV